MMIIKIIIIIINLTAGSLIISLLSIVFQVCLNSAITDTNAPMAKDDENLPNEQGLLGFL